MKCPLCKGTGQTPSTPKKYKKALSLKKEGYSLRLIAKELGYKHPWSVKHLLLMGDKHF